MAFNPFDVFRRNTKTLMALLTVFVMIMFVVSFGQGDLFDMLARWTASSARTGKEIGTLEGRKVYTHDLAELDEGRVLANQYMFTAANIAQLKLLNYIQEGSSRMSSDFRGVVDALIRMRSMGYFSQNIQQRMMMAQFGQGQPPSQEELLSDQERTVISLLTGLSQIAADEEATEDDADIAKAAQHLIELDMHLMTADARRRHYFSNQPMNETEDFQDQLEFSLWLRKADQLGIYYTSSDINRLTAEEFWYRLNDNDWRQAVSDVENKPIYTPQRLIRALGNEFRVRAAQSAVMGQDVARNTWPLVQAYESPFSYFEYFREQTSPARYGLIRIPAENYLDKVEGEPTERQLRDIFARYKGTEPNPTSAAPGLRDPRKLKLAWLEATGKEEFYTKAAEEALPLIETQIKLMAMAGTSLNNIGPVGIALALAVNKDQNLLLTANYQDARRRFAEDVESEWYVKPTSQFSNVRPLATSVARAENLAAGVGVLTGSLFTGGSWLSAPIVAEQSVAVYERERRAAALASLLVPSITLGERLASIADHLASVPQPLPLELMRDRLAEEVKTDLSFTICNLDLRQFQTDLSAIGEKLDSATFEEQTKLKTEAEEKANEFISTRKLTHGQSTKATDQYQMGSDPGLAPLLETVLGPHSGISMTIRFGRQFFFTVSPNGREIPASGLFQPMAYPDPSLSGPRPNSSEFLVWRTEDVPADSPKDFNRPEVQEKLKAAWRRLEARKLAEKAARNLAKECDNLGNDDVTIVPNLLDKRRQFSAQFSDETRANRITYSEIRDVAPMVMGPGLMPGRQNIGSFRVEPSGDIPFPRNPEMTEKLLDARDKEPSTTVVLKDNPEENFYVAVLLGRDLKKPSDFIENVLGNPAMAMFNPATQVISRFHQFEMLQNIRKQAIELLKAEFRFVPAKPEPADGEEEPAE